MTGAVPPPAEGGQGDDGEGGGPYDLSAVPEHMRPHVEPLFKQASAAADAKFREHAEYRSQWEPWEQTGINQFDPGEVQDILGKLSDPDSFRQYIEENAEALGLFADEEPGTEEDGEESDPYADQLQSVEQRLEEAEQWRSQYEEQGRLGAANEFIDTQLAQLREEHGEFPDERVVQLALAYDGEDAIKQGFADWQEIQASVERQAVSQKIAQPDAPEAGGQAATGAEPITTWDQAGKAARERIAQLNQP